MGSFSIWHWMVVLIVALIIVVPLLRLLWRLGDRK